MYGGIGGEEGNMGKGVRIVWGMRGMMGECGVRLCGEWGSRTVERGEGEVQGTRERGKRGLRGLGEGG